VFGALGWAGVVLLALGGFYNVADHPPAAREQPYMGYAWPTWATTYMCRVGPVLWRIGAVLLLAAAVGTLVT
jgi:hypothetical protein